MNVCKQSRRVSVGDLPGANEEREAGIVPCAGDLCRSYRQRGHERLERKVVQATIWNDDNSFPVPKKRLDGFTSFWYAHGPRQDRLWCPTFVSSADTLHSVFKIGNVRHRYDIERCSPDNEDPDRRRPHEIADERGLIVKEFPEWIAPSPRLHRIARHDRSGTPLRVFPQSPSSAWWNRNNFSSRIDRSGTARSTSCCSSWLSQKTISVLS